MRAIWFMCALLIAHTAAAQVSTQQNNVDRKQFEELRVRAERGDVNAQEELGRKYYLAKDFNESLRWFLKAADQGDAKSQLRLGAAYYSALGVPQDFPRAVFWLRKAAEQGDAKAQFLLGHCYRAAKGVPEDLPKAFFWFRKAAEQGNAMAQNNLGQMLRHGQGCEKNIIEAVEWFRKAAEQGDAESQAIAGGELVWGEPELRDYKEGIRLLNKAAEQDFVLAQSLLGTLYWAGIGVPQDYVQAYFWISLAVAHGNTNSISARDSLLEIMTPQQIAQGQQLAREFKPQKASDSGEAFSNIISTDSVPKASGTGFFITKDGFLITNEHVVREATQVRLVTNLGIISAKVVKVDAANDLALLQAEGKFSALPVATSRSTKLGNTVATVGFPNIGLQGFAPKLAKGEIASLAGAQDDPRYFQISVPIQPGNSGGALVDERGNVVGVVAAKLNANAALETSGALPENVNYAVKSSFLLGFLESVPAIFKKLKAPNTIEQKFEDVVRSAEKAAVLVLVY